MTTHTGSVSSLSHLQQMPQQPTQLESSTGRLLTQKISIFSDLFNKLDIDNDGVLNAQELRAMFTYLFGDAVSNEHLQHFENRYLLLYGENGGLSKKKFLKILTDFENAHGYKVEQDIKEFYLHFVTEEEPKISPENLCKGINDLLPNELKPKLIYFKERLTRSLKSGSELNYDNFHLVICALFKTYNYVLEPYQLVSPIVEQTAAIANPFHRRKFNEKVALYGSQTDREKMKAAMTHLLTEVSKMKPSKSHNRKF